MGSPLASRQLNSSTEAAYISTSRSFRWESMGFFTGSIAGRPLIAFFSSTISCRSRRRNTSARWSVRGIFEGQDACPVRASRHHVDGDHAHFLIRQLTALGRRDMPVLVAPLPADPTFVSASGQRFPVSRHPYFVMCGTLEPRKNHLLVLHVWRDLIARFGRAAPKFFWSANGDGRMSTSSICLTGVPHCRVRSFEPRASRRQA